MSENTISILIGKLSYRASSIFKLATDNHLGFMEKDPIREQDSFISFAEILEHARNRNVDMMILGGDLFHENKPSRKTLYQCMELLREYGFGDRLSQLEYLSDPTINFSSKFPNVNYQDPNINVAIPIFAIHGNHDDPSGDNALSAMDILSVAGLINFFGKVKDVDDISVSPILLSKGSTKLALYGIGNIRDERLYRSFQRKRVKMLRPIENQDDWFNLLVFHQNRASHGPTNFIPEQFIDDLIDFVVWGHEHECLIDPQINPQRNIHICQPGSSVATSLSEGEAKPKHIALINITGRSYQLEKIPLKCIRPFLLKELSLKSFPELRPLDMKQINRVLIEQVDLMISQAEPILNEMKRIKPELAKPLIRLKVDYSEGYLSINPLRFGQQFVDRVANPKDILLFYRKKTPINFKEKRKSHEDHPTPMESLELAEMMNVEDLISEFLNLQNLNLLPENEFGDAVKAYIDKDDKGAIEKFIDHSLKKFRTKLKDKQGIYDESKLIEQIENEKENMEMLWDRESTTKDLKKATMEKSNKSVEMIATTSTRAVKSEILFSDDHEESSSPMPRAIHNVPFISTVKGGEMSAKTKLTSTSISMAAPKASRGKGRGRGSTTVPKGFFTKSSKRGGGRARQSTLDLYSASQGLEFDHKSIEDEDIVIHESSDLEDSVPMKPIGSRSSGLLSDDDDAEDAAVSELKLSHGSSLSLARPSKRKT